MRVARLPAPGDAGAPEGEPDHEKRGAERRDRALQEGEDEFRRRARKKARNAAIALRAVAADEDVEEACELRHQIHEEEQAVERHRGAGGKIREIAVFDRLHRRERDHDGEGRHAEEHQDRPDELEAAHESQARNVEQLQILQIALAPAQIAPREFENGRRVFLPASVFLRQHADLVAGAAHQGRLDLVVRHHRPAERRPAGQHGQVAFVAERRDADHRVVAPEGAAIADPPGAAHRVAAHAVAHAELEDSREGGR